MSLFSSYFYKRLSRVWVLLESHLVAHRWTVWRRHPPPAPPPIQLLTPFALLPSCLIVPPYATLMCSRSHLHYLPDSTLPERQSPSVSVLCAYVLTRAYCHLICVCLLFPLSLVLLLCRSVLSPLWCYLQSDHLVAN